jgi:hypothetical protein
MLKTQGGCQGESKDRKGTASIGKVHFKLQEQQAQQGLEQ